MKLKKPRRRGGTAPVRRPSRSAADGYVVLRRETGEIMHVALPHITASLRAAVARLRLADELPPRLGVISAIRGEGVTFISRSLALVLANDSGESVCVVDLNWAAPARWGDGGGEDGGLADVLRGTMSLEDAIVTTGEPALAVLPAGEASAEEAPVFAASAALGTVLEELGRRFDYLIFDLPSLHAASEALTLASHADAVMVVVRQGVTPEGLVRAALDQMDSVLVLGVVLNAFSTDVPSMITRRVPAL